jgi:gliding motility-associated-like protein
MSLTTTPSAGLSYQWKNNETVVEESENNFFTASVTGKYTVTVTSQIDEACVFTSNEVVVTVESTSPLTSPAQINEIEPICIGATLNLSAVDIGASDYKWTGPNGYEGTGLVANPAISDFQRQNAGRYFLEVFAGTCVSEKTSMVVQVFDAPEFRLTADEMEIICDGKPKKITINPQPAGFTYQWYEVTRGALAGATDPSLVATENGSYYAKATTTPACASGETPVSKIIFTNAPVASFEAPESVCPGESITFLNTSTGDVALGLTYLWKFGDGTESNDQHPTHVYPLPSTYTVNLKVQYENGSCAETTTKTIVVDTSPEVVITTANGAMDLCPGESLTLVIEDTFETYNWETGEQTAELIVDEPGFYSVTVSTASGCEGTGSINIGQFQKPVVTVQASAIEINEGESVQLTASGLQDYHWTPADAVDFPESPVTNGSPLVSTVYTVSGKDENGCPGEAQIEIFVKGDVATKKIIPSKFFSPENGDDINKFWIVDKILNYPRCGVTIFDDKGVKVFEAKPYLNDWDGSYNGKQLPDGVYFYIIRCDGEENSPKTGSVTIIR